MGDLTLTVGPAAGGKQLAIISTGGHPKKPGSGDCVVLDIQVVDGWSREQITDWFQRTCIERPWETRQ